MQYTTPLHRFIRSLFTGILCLILLASCDDDNSSFSHTPEIVVEGWIENGGFPVVILTETVSLTQGNQFFEKKVIRWAKVTISDGEKSVVLTGGYDARYYPPYTYTTTYMRGETGKKYTLEVKYNDYLATAETTIPSVATVDSVIASPCTDSNTLYQIKAYVNDNPEEKNYYRVFSQVLRKETCYFASIPGTIDDAVTGNRNPIEIPVYKGMRDTEKEKYSPFFTIGDEVMVKIAQIDSVSYNFWIDYENAVSSISNNMLFPSTKNLRSNISGGKGYWCGYGASIHKVKF